ncbi:hypothetical protein FJTKL_08638 [Diaporthe vaccinii]|uniref:Uncharacterized protein n=1 Tax=Diaporthe vaccinii TaxID=105482 RepID=A0ABR4EQU7_9PEZI
MKKGPSIRSIEKIEVTFWSDSKLVLTALRSSARAQSLSQKMQHILEIIKLKTQELLKEPSADVSVQFRWCPEECVEPHATADQLSKGARISGRTMYSKALTLFHAMPHSKIQSALGQARTMASDAKPAAQSSSSGAGSSLADQAAKAQNLALRTITKDPVILNVLYRAAGSSRFFSIVSGTVECLPSNLRPSMHEAIREQQDANKKLQRCGWGPSNERSKHHELASTSPYPNLFALIEITACNLPAYHQEKLITAIRLQKKANACLVQEEVVGQVYQFEGDNNDMDHDPKAFEEPETQENVMGSGELETAEEPTVMVEESEKSEDPAKVTEELEPSESTVLDEPMDLDEPGVHAETEVHGETEVHDEQNIIEKPKTVEEPIYNIDEVLEYPQILQNPEMAEEARPNRLRAVWAWVERRFQRF